MGRLHARLLMALVGLAVLAVYVAAAMGGLLLLAWLVASPPDLWLVLVGVAIAVVVGAVLSHRLGSARLLAGIDAVELPRGRAPALYRRLERLSESMGLDAPPLLVADLGAPNALSVGGPRRGVIVLDRRLLDLLTLDELEGIVAHELAHVERHDAFVQTLAVSVLRLLAGLLFVLFLPVTLVFAGVGHASAWFAGQPHRAPDVAAIATRGVEVLVGAVLSVLTLWLLAYSRRREFAADRRAVDVTGRPDALARALAKIHRAANPTWGFRSLLTIHGDERDGLHRLLSTHPPIGERIERLVDADRRALVRRRGVAQ